MDSPQKQKENTIQEIGSYLEVNDQGFLVNPASINKIQPEWRPAVDEILNAYKEKCGDVLHSVYLRGSVAKGAAVPFVSDIDTFAYVNLTKEQIRNGMIDLSWIESLQNSLKAKYPFVQGFEIYIDPLAHAMKDKITLLQSVCLCGEDITKEVSEMKVGRELFGHMYAFEKDLAGFEEWIKETHTPEEIQEECVWLMKRFLRTGLELTLERAGKYTRDLYPCYKVFAEYYPEKDTMMKEVLRLAINPSNDIESLKSVVKDFGGWMLKEAQKAISQDTPLQKTVFKNTSVGV